MLLTNRTQIDLKRRGEGGGAGEEEEEDEEVKAVHCPQHSRLDTCRLAFLLIQLDRDYFSI